ncbi:MAG: GFA family protein, partial [Pseudobdellovibrionaceae bacterium]
KSERSSTVTRNFCKECGCHIFSEISDVPEIITLKVETHDDLSVFVPQYLAWVRSADSQFWYQNVMVWCLLRALIESKSKPTTT